MHGDRLEATDAPRVSWCNLLDSSNDQTKEGQSNTNFLRAISLLLILSRHNNVSPENLPTGSIHFWASSASFSQVLCSRATFTAQLC